MTKDEQIKGMANPNRGSVGVQEARPAPVQLEQEPVYHLRQYGDVTKEQFEHYAQTGSIATPAAQRQHVTDGSLCWCEPETSYTDPETGASVIVHKGPQ